MQVDEEQQRDNFVNFACERLQNCELSTEQAERIVSTARSRARLHRDRIYDPIESYENLGYRYLSHEDRGVRDMAIFLTGIVSKGLFPVTKEEAQAIITELWFNYGRNHQQSVLYPCLERMRRWLGEKE